MVERPFTVRWDVGSILHGGPIELYQCIRTGLTNAVVCAILSMVHIKDYMLLIVKRVIIFPIRIIIYHMSDAIQSYIKCVECVIK